MTAVNIATDQGYTAKTDGQGDYNILYLLPANYTVKVKAPNFETAVFSNVVLVSAQKRGLNVTLSPGGVSQQVVTEAGDLLDTVDATTGGVVDQLKVDSMPTSGRQVWDDIAFTTGIRSLAVDPFDITPRSNVNQYTVSGVSGDANAFFVNGAPVSDRGHCYFVPEQGAVHQVQASANPYDAQYGRTGGGAFNANVTSGSDRFDGSVSDARPGVRPAHATR